MDPAPSHFPAAKIRGSVLAEACCYYEFVVMSYDDREERVRIEAEVVHTGRLRDFFGFNRAKHAVVEAAILATRTGFLPHFEIVAEYRKLAIIVEKTGGPREHQAFTFLQTYLDQGIDSHTADSSEGRA